MESFASRAALSSKTFGQCSILLNRPLKSACAARARRPAPRRFLHSASTSGAPRTKIPDFAFVFDIDGVLLRGKNPLDGAHRALTYLKEQKIPFILLTNGGGMHETKRAELLTKQIGVEIIPSTIVQSHTPFAGLEHFKDRPTLVVGGHKRRCADVAVQYGFKRVYTPSQIWCHYPHIWPFSLALGNYHKSEAAEVNSLPGDITSNKDGSAPENLKIDSVFVYNDPRDWGLDIAVIVDCLLSRQGFLGTASAKNGDSSLTNKGYQQDGQPPLYFSNPDLWFAAEWNLPRLGQGGFKAALEGVWAEITGGPRNGVELQMKVLGKPFQDTYEFAEKKLDMHRQTLSEDFSALAPLKQVYMVGDNPASDIRGACEYKSPVGTAWSSALVRSGVYTGGQLSVEPTTIVDNVEAAVDWAVKRSGWDSQ